MPRIERRASIRVPKSGKKLVCSINRWGWWEQRVRKVSVN